MESKKHRSNFAEDYASYRPSYPRELHNKLTTIARLGPGRVVADVGSGTGILTRQLLEGGARVIGIEPNAAMRDAADRDLLGHPRFDSRAALPRAAEAGARIVCFPEASCRAIPGGSAGP